MEAMKMQNSLVAGKTGKVVKVRLVTLHYSLTTSYCSQVNCAEGQTVDEGAVLVELA